MDRREIKDMMIATTGCLQAGSKAPIVYRGAFEDIFPKMAADGYQAVEMHIQDSREINREKLNEQLEINHLKLTSIGTGMAYGTWHLNIGDHNRDIRNRAIACIEEHMITASPHHSLVILGSMQGRFSDAASAEEFVSNVEEIISNYDIDGIHFDYIRYPDNRGQFPDDGLYRLYGKGLSRADWRRNNITRFVTKVYDLVKKEKPWVQVSSSPLGRYRTLNDRGRGWTALETVFQDAATWLKMGKHDALYPMMYYKDHLFYPFVDDWLENGNKRIIVPGLGTYQMIELGWSRQDIVDQMDYTRKNESAGQAYFRTDNVLSNTKGILNTLDQYYRYPAKLPAMTWLSDEIPEAPYDLTAESINGKLLLNWKIGDAGARVTYNVYRSESEDFDVHKAENILATGLRKPFFEYAASVDEKGYYYYVTVSDSYHNESEICCPAFFVHSETVK